ncbi:hypothetical protein STEG23_003022, partial [Scotinomys teguina]
HFKNLNVDLRVEDTSLNQYSEVDDFLKQRIAMSTAYVVPDGQSELTLQLEIVIGGRCILKDQFWPNSVDCNFLTTLTRPVTNFLPVDLPSVAYTQLLCLWNNVGKKDRIEKKKSAAAKGRDFSKFTSIGQEKKKAKPQMVLHVVLRVEKPLSSDSYRSSEPFKSPLYRYH